jgi:hypothetical protein
LPIFGIRITKFSARIKEAQDIGNHHTTEQGAGYGGYQQALQVGIIVSA